MVRKTWIIHTGEKERKKEREKTERIRGRGSLNKTERKRMKEWEGTCIRGFLFRSTKHEDRQSIRKRSTKFTEYWKIADLPHRRTCEIWQLYDSNKKCLKL